MFVGARPPSVYSQMKVTAEIVLTSLNRQEIGAFPPDYAPNRNNRSLGAQILFTEL